MSAFPGSKFYDASLGPKKQCAISGAYVQEDELEEQRGLMVRPEEIDDEPDGPGHYKSSNAEG